ncbi:MAG: CoA-binding protein, partial [Aestuariibacter sp.]|nr:CoA-binding protein [Aestuariibacter sp.]
ATLNLPPLSAKHIALDEAEAKQQLAEYGVIIPHGVRLPSDIIPEFPVVLKALGITHKTEQNAVRLNLTSEAEIEQAKADLNKLSKPLYLESMVQAPVAELIVGITRDAQFGLVLTIGSGGVLVEILQDSQTLLVPASRDDVEDAISQLKSLPLLQGYRGKPAADMVAAVEAVLAIQTYALAQSEKLIELDVNPLLLCAAGKGVFAADALIILEET